MATESFYHQIILEHNNHPGNRKILPKANLTREGKNPSCGDDIVLQLCVEDGIITDGSFIGDGCAISQASVDMMLDLMIGKKKEEALRLSDLFIRMIRSELTEEEKETLEDELLDAVVLEEISRNPARVKCAVLGWHTLTDLLSDTKEG